ncbi:MAG: hypothetical protein K4H23_04600, partial [Mollicutes bacterium PWAP]|nr:hypothetical protein [Mollicutes bacterium PWAP]
FNFYIIYLMRKVYEFNIGKNGEKLKKDIREKVSKQHFEKLSKINYKNVPKKFKLGYNKTFIYFSIIFFFFIVPLIIIFFKRKNFVQFLNDQILVRMNSNDWNNILTTTTPFSLKKFKADMIPNLKKSFDFSMKNALSHRKASIDYVRVSPNYNLYIFNKNYQSEMQQYSIEFHYYDLVYIFNNKGGGYWKELIRFGSYEDSINLIHTGVKYNDVKGLAIDVNISTSNKYKNSFGIVSKIEKIKFENKLFNKKYKIKTNNKIKSNMFFTPLAQEHLSSLSNIIGRPQFIIRNDKAISFGQFKEWTITDDFQFKGKIMKKGVESMIDNLTNVYYDSIITFIESIGPIAVLPIFDYSKEDLDFFKKKSIKINKDPTFEENGKKRKL